ncbi:MAG: glycoside hydrolase family 11 protein [Lachnoclostridium sp.]|jgi:endo-1,4-beta-xylanase|nr:glycoside hydrolase family 11 protein [Lachnoclostridium sp.]
MNKTRKRVASLLMVMVLSVSCLIPANAYAALNYVQNWNDGIGTVYFSNNGKGNFSIQWSNAGNFVCGVGWNPGSTNRRLGYNVGAISSTGSGFAGLYGWTRNPLIEYYVVEVYPNGRKPVPPNASFKGTVYSDGGSYEIYTSMRYSQPSIDGPATFQQFWSIRSQSNTVGQNHTITFANHVNAWRNAGMYLGSSMAYQAFVGEGYNSSGYVNATAWES